MSNENYSSGEMYQEPGGHKEKEGGDPSQWMLSFIDLVSLLTSFFVLLYSMSAVESAKFKEISKSLNSALATGEKVEGSIAVENTLTVPKISVHPAGRLDYLYSLVYQKLNQLKFGSQVRLIRYEDRLAISLSGDNFVPGTTNLSPNAAATIPLLGDLVGSLTNQVEIIAGPDQTETKSDQYSSGWQLALARALVVSDMIKQRGYFGPINSFGRAGVVLDDPGQPGEFSSRIDIVIEDKAAETF